MRRKASPPVPVTSVLEITTATHLRGLHEYAERAGEPAIAASIAAHWREAEDVWTEARAHKLAVDEAARALEAAFRGIGYQVAALLIREQEKGT